MMKEESKEGGQVRSDRNDRQRDRKGGGREKEQREAKHAGNEADFIPKEVVAGEE